MVKLTLRERESIQEAVRRFRKLVERSGIKKEMRRREYYEKPSEIKRRARLRAERRSRRGSMLGAAPDSDAPSEASFPASHSVSFDSTGLVKPIRADFPGTSESVLNSGR